MSKIKKLILPTICLLLTLSILGLFCSCGIQHSIDIDVTYFVDPQTGVNYVQNNKGICPRYNADGTLYVGKPTYDKLKEL